MGSLDSANLLHQFMNRYRNALLFGFWILEWLLLVPGSF